MAPILSKELYAKIRDFLRDPSLDLTSKSRRDELLTDAFYFYNSSIYTAINQEGGLDIFINHLLRKLDDYGCFEGRHPVAILLESLYRTESEQRKKVISQLLKEVDPLCIEDLDVGTIESHDTSSTTIEAATIIGKKYQLLKNGLINQGDYGEVWQAYQIGGIIGRIVAIKLARLDIPKDTQISLSTEIGLIARLEHPHIVPIYDWDRENMTYLVMRLLRVGTLRDRLKKPLPRPVATEYLRQMANALQYAHTVGIFHGSLEPRNILFDDKIEHLYLSNFSLSYPWEKQFELNRRYAAPEQILGSVNAETDQYSLAVIAFEMFTGSCPFTEASALSSKLPSYPQYLSEAMYKVLSRACSQQPYHRFPNILAFADAMQMAIDLGQEPGSWRDEEQKYLASLVNDCQQRLHGYVNLPGIKQEPRATNHLKSLSSTGASRGFVRHPMLYQPRRSSKDLPEEPTEDVRDTILTLQRTVLLGEPGSGKTTTLYQITLDCARKAQLDSLAPIPVFIPLTLFQGEIPFDMFVRQQMSNLGYRLEDYLTQPDRIIFLFDALNETLISIKTEVISYLNDLPRFVISCRTKDYNQELSSIEYLSTVTILDLDPPRIRRAMILRVGEQGHQLWAEVGGEDLLLEFWDALVNHNEQARFWYLDKVPSYSREEADRVWIKMHDRGVLPLCRNPFMLALTCDLYQFEGSIPSNRGELFNRFVLACVDSEIERIGNVENWKENDDRYFSYKKLVLDILTNIAQEIQLQKLGTGIGRTQALSLLIANWTEGQINLGLSLARDSALIAMSSDQILFSHQLIQEYFASNIMGQALDCIPQQSATLFFNPINWWEQQGWEETAVILAGVRGRKELSKVVRWLAEAQPALAVRCIEESGIPGVSIENIDIELRQWLQTTWTQRIDYTREPVIARAVIGKALGNIGDPRAGVGVKRYSGGLIPDIRWCTVPNKTFQISCYPVTNQQFELFVKAEDGYDRSEWWDFSDEAVQWHQRNPAPIGTYNKEPNCPRVDVSWFEARAYCNWMTHRIGELIGLPLEVEWEYAARGPNRYLYPWGDEFIPDNANVMIDLKLSLNHVSPVGIYPQIKSYCGAEDMIGNVWEWCNDVFECDRSIPREEDLYRLSTRILKGGSWFYRPEFSYCNYKFYAFPSYRNKDVGFRVIQLT